jgi:putative zinc finger protein
MKSCGSFKSSLPLFAGGELNEAEHRIVELHLARCEDCREETLTFSQVINTARNMPLSEYQLPVAVRNRIALEAAEGATRGLWGLPVPVLFFSPRPGLLAAAAAVVLALVALPVTLRHGSGPARQSEVSALDITVDGGVTRLAWSNGSRDSYKVYKSTDPRVLEQSEVHIVRGSVWTDTEPESSAIVFYKIN